MEISLMEKSTPVQSTKEKKASKSEHLTWELIKFLFDLFRTVLLFLSDFSETIRPLDKEISWVENFFYF